MINAQQRTHQAVLLEEVQKFLHPQKDAYYIDATFGRGSHSRALLNLGAKVIAFDFDQEAIERAQETFSSELETGSLQLFRENFTQMESIVKNLQKTNLLNIQGILFDFGTSTDQLMSEERGFSFNSSTEKLDMRMDQRLGVQATDLLKVLNVTQLTHLLREYGGEKMAQKIAHEIVRVRQEDLTSLDHAQTLLDIIEKIKGKQKAGKIHPATKTFQALRIVVNNELDNIQEALNSSLKILRESEARNKRLVCISFHEGEDRLVKNFFKESEASGKAKILTKKAVMATEAEMEKNKRARSARLRALAL